MDQPSAPKDPREPYQGPERRSEPRMRGRFSLKVKLIGIISAIIFCALSLMTILATGFFRRDSAARVQENNINLVELIGAKTESEMRALSGLAALFIASNTSDAGKFFRDHGEIIFVGTAPIQGGGIGLPRGNVNTRYLETNSIAMEEIERLHVQSLAIFLPSAKGAVVAENISPGFPKPILGIGLPSGQGSVLIVYVDADVFLKSFTTSESESRVTQAFMVNAKGEIVAHPDVKLVMARASMASLPIIRTLLDGKVKLGQTRYIDSDGVAWLGSYRKIDFGNLGIVSTAEESRVFEAVNAIQYRNLIILVIVVALSILIVFYYSRTITVPVIALVEATKQIERGNFKLKVKGTSRDEIGHLAHSFGHMVRGLEEREKIKDAFGRFVNKEIAERAMRGELHLGGERKICAIFFSDLRGFTAMSEKMRPEQVVEYLNSYFSMMVKCVNETEGIVDKFIGDAIMAHWGAIKELENDTQSAIDAALRMRSALLEFNSIGAGKDLPAKFGCGINTGPVVAGQIGSEDRLDFTVIGDAVNLASRIEALNKPFGTDILIGFDSYIQSGGVYRVEEMSPVTVKGKSEPLRIYAVLGREDDPSSPKTVEELRILIGAEYDEEKAAHAGEEVKYKIEGEPA